MTDSGHNFPTSLLKRTFNCRSVVTDDIHGMGHLSIHQIQNFRYHKHLNTLSCHAFPASSTKPRTYS